MHHIEYKIKWHYQLLQSKSFERYSIKWKSCHKIENLTFVLKMTWFSWGLPMRLYTSIYHSTFNYIFFEKVKSYIIIIIECWDLRQLQGKKKYKNWWKPKSFLLLSSALLQTMHPIIDNIFPSYNFGENLFCTILAIENVVKGGIVSHV